MKSTDELKKEITEATERELDPRQKERARREKVKQFDQEFDFVLREIIKGKDWLRDNHPDVFRKDPWTPKKWLRKGKLGKQLSRTRFEEVYAELAWQALSFNSENRKLTRKLGGYAWEGERPEKEATLPDGTVQPAEKKRMDLVVIPDVGEIAEELIMSERNVRLYLSEMVRCGVLIELPNKLGRGQRAFKMGEWGYYPDQRTGTIELRRYWTLKSTDKKMLEKLRTFKVGGE
jgi:hypothetical protein